MSEYSHWVVFKNVGKMYIDEKRPLYAEPEYKTTEIFLGNRLRPYCFIETVAAYNVKTGMIAIGNIEQFVSNIWGRSENNYVNPFLNIDDEDFEASLTKGVTKLGKTKDTRGFIAKYAYKRRLNLITEGVYKVDIMAEPKNCWDRCKETIDVWNQEYAKGSGYSSNFHHFIEDIDKCLDYKGRFGEDRSFSILYNNLWKPIFKAKYSNNYMRTKEGRRSAQWGTTSDNVAVDTVCEHYKLSDAKLAVADAVLEDTIPYLNARAFKNAEDIKYVEEPYKPIYILDCFKDGYYAVADISCTYMPYFITETELKDWLTKFKCANAKLENGEIVETDYINKSEHNFIQGEKTIFGYGECSVLTEEEYRKYANVCMPACKKAIERAAAMGVTSDKMFELIKVIIDKLNIEDSRISDALLFKMAYEIFKDKKMGKLRAVWKDIYDSESIKRDYVANSWRVDNLIKLRKNKFPIFIDNYVFSQIKYTPDDYMLGSDLFGLDSNSIFR